MNDLTVTITGWAATDPKLHIGASGAAMCTFRLATTPRRFDRNAGEWIDGDTEWFTVRAFRAGAMTVHESIRKGQPVVVTGRMRTNSWEAADGPRTDLQVDATAVGHDLTRGVASFTRATGDATLGADARQGRSGADGDEADDALDRVEEPPRDSAWETDVEAPIEDAEGKLATAVATS